MHTILGAGGPISKALVGELEKTGNSIRLVSRRNISVSGNVSWRRGDLLNFTEVLHACTGSEVIYLCAGLKYDRNVWKEQWPKIMQNVIDVGKQLGSRIVFFDNVYMYGRVEGEMTEETPYNPCSVKGEIRAKIAASLMEESRAGNIRASIARSADFYGSDSKNSFFDLLVLEKLMKKKTAQWLGNAKALHNFTYVPDAGKALYLLGQTPEADNQIWHVPTAKAVTGVELINITGETFNFPPKYSSVNRALMYVGGVFSKDIKESIEMFYQYQFDYKFNSSKFEIFFGVKPKTFPEGLREIKERMK